MLGTMTKRALALSLFALAGCSSSSPAEPASGLIPGFEPPAPKANEVQLVSPVFAGIQPGQDVTYCTIMKNPFTTDVDLVASIGAYSKPGHHAVLFDVGNWGTPGDTHVCNDDDMSRARFIGGASDQVQNFPIPDGIALRLRAGSNVMVQTHWINFTQQPMDGQVAFNLEGLAADGSRQLAGSFTVNSTQIDVAPHATGRTVHDCKVEKDLTMFLLAGHEHEWGTHVLVEQTTGSATTTLYDVAWKTEYQTNAPRNLYTKDAPLVLHAGDNVRVTCDWLNSTTSPLAFPQEMCVAFGMFYPATQDIDCNDGVWSETSGQ